MADMTRQIPITIRDAQIARVTAFINSLPVLMQDSGEVDPTGAPIMEEVSETLVEKFDRYAKQYVVDQLRARVLKFEQRQAVSSVTEIPVE